MCAFTTLARDACEMARAYTILFTTGSKFYLSDITALQHVTLFKCPNRIDYYKWSNKEI